MHWRCPACPQNRSGLLSSGCRSALAPRHARRAPAHERIEAELIQVQVSERSAHQRGLNDPRGGMHEDPGQPQQPARKQAAHTGTRGHQASGERREARESRGRSGGALQSGRRQGTREELHQAVPRRAAMALRVEHAVRPAELLRTAHVHASAASAYATKNGFELLLRLAQRSTESADEEAVWLNALRRVMRA